MNKYDRFHKGQDTLHPIPVPAKEWSQISINLIGPS